MTYTGYKINKVSRYIFSNYDNKDGYFWNVNKNCKNVLFSTLKEAKEWVNNAIRKEKILEEMKARFTTDEILARSKRDGERPMGFLMSYIKDEYGLPKQEAFPIAVQVLAETI